MTPNTGNQYGDFLATWGGLAGVVSLIVTVLVTLRGWYRDRSHLWFIHNEDMSEESFVRTLYARSPGQANHVIGTATLVVSNNSSRPNAIVRWDATVRDVQGTVHNVDMSGPQHLGDYPPFNIMVSVPAFTSAEAHLLFYVDVRTLPNPVVFQVNATDRSQRIHHVSVSIPNAVRNTLQQ